MKRNPIYSLKSPSVLDKVEATKLLAVLQKLAKPELKPYLSTEPIIQKDK